MYTLPANVDHASEFDASVGRVSEKNAGDGVFFVFLAEHPLITPHLFSVGR